MSVREYRRRVLVGLRRNHILLRAIAEHLNIKVLDSEGKAIK